MTLFFRRLLRIPLFYKILIANSAIVTLGAIVGTVVTVWHVQTYQDDIHYELIAIFAGAGLIISFLVNNWVLKKALTPLGKLQNAVDRVGEGDLGVRIERSAVSDRQFDRLAVTFNHMLEQLEHDSAQLQRLSRKIIQAQEEERQRLARELHDEAAQALTSLLVQLRLLERAYNPEEAQKRVKELRELTAQALDEVRRVALDLRPTILDDLGLAAALDWRVDEINKGGLAQASFTTSGMGERLPRDIELVFYRIGQEALTNALRHGEAQAIEVTLGRKDGELTLAVQDNGRGFSPERAAAEEEGGSGLGLLGMRERIAMVNGRLDIDSRPGEGCRITVVAPLGGRKPLNGRRSGSETADQVERRGST